MTLFIGGPVDGTRRYVDKDFPTYRIAVRSHKTTKQPVSLFDAMKTVEVDYERVALVGSGGRHDVFVPVGEDAIELLIKGYNKGCKCAER